MKRMLLQEQNWAPDGVPNSHMLYIWSVVHQMNECTGHDIDDLFGEACLKYTLCRDNWDPSRGKFSTYIHTSLKNHLRDYLWKTWNVNRKLSDGVKIQFIPYERAEHLILAERARCLPTPFQTFSV